MLPSEYTNAMRSGLAEAAVAPRTTSEAAARRLAARRTGWLILGFRDVDDLTVGEAIGGAEPLAVPGRRLAGELVRGDLRAFLDDDLALALRIGLHHRDLALRVDEVAHPVNRKQRDHQPDDEHDRDVEEIGDARQRIFLGRIVRRREMEKPRHVQAS